MSQSKPNGSKSAVQWTANRRQQVLINDLQDIAETIQTVPNDEDIETHSDYSIEAYRYWFCTLDNARAEAGLPSLPGGGDDQARKHLYHLSEMLNDE